MRRGYVEVHIASLLLGIAGGLLMWSAVVGFFKSLFGSSASVNVGGGQSATAGRDAYQAGRDVIVNPVPEATERPPWWFRDGAPEVGISFASNRTNRDCDADLRFTSQVKEVEVRNSTLHDGEWYTPKTGTTSRARDGWMSFHIGHMNLPNDDADFEIEVRFWWGNEERHVLFKDTVGNFFAANRLPIADRW